MNTEDLNAAARNLEAASRGQDINDIWAGLHQLGDALARFHQEHRERQRQIRNARARQRYAARKAAGLPGRPAKAEPEPTADLYDYDVEPGCRCQHSPMPPCSWCCGGGHYCDTCEQPSELCECESVGYP